MFLLTYIHTYVCTYNLISISVANTANQFETIDNTGLNDLLNMDAVDDDETTDGEDNYSEEICGLTGKFSIYQ